MTPAFVQIGRLYERCLASYTKYGEGTGYMHMPVWRRGCSSRGACLQELTDVVCHGVSLGEGDVVFDLGCGVGSILVALAKSYPISGVGWAASQREIVEARRRSEVAGVAKRCQFVCRDFNDLSSVPSASAKLVLTVETDGYFQSMVHAAREIRRVLKKGGEWRTVRYSCLGREECSRRMQRSIRRIERWWRLSQLGDACAFEEAIRKGFATCEVTPLGPSVVAFWEHFVGIPLESCSRIVGRFCVRTLSEIRSPLDVYETCLNRLAFWLFIRGLSEGWLQHTFYRLVAV